jgi:hypothetical protein
VGKPLVRFGEGPGCNSDHGRYHVAPSENQAANREHKLRPTVRGVPGLLETRADHQDPGHPDSTDFVGSDRMQTIKEIVHEIADHLLRAIGKASAL